MKRRVALTGIGLLTPCGRGWQSFWDSACANRSALRPFSRFSLPKPIELPYAGEIQDFDPKEYVKQRKSLKVMSREIQMAVAASFLALEDGGVNPEQIDCDLFGVYVGCGIINTELDEIGAGIRAGLDAEGRFQSGRFGSEGIPSLFPLWFLKYLPNMPACHVSITYGLRGPSNTITTSSCAAAQAIGEAARTIERGDALFMLAGGTDSKLNGIGLSRLFHLGLLAGKESMHPQDSSMDTSLSGIVPAEGAGFLVLEEYEHALSRGARIYAEIAGYGSAADLDGDPRYQKDLRAKELCLSRALKDAGLSAEQIQIMIANASGLRDQDELESQAVRSVWGRQMEKIHITASKLVTGHLLYAAGAVDTALAALCLYFGRVPPAEAPEGFKEVPGLSFVRELAAVSSRTAVVNSFGLTGQNACLVLNAGDRADV